MSYDRYKRFRKNGKVEIPPFVKIVEKSPDYFETYRKGSSRLDLISYDYYGDPGYDWLILMANASIANLEFEIPDNSVLRIPYPLDLTLENFNEQINRYETLNK